MSDALVQYHLHRGVASITLDSPHNRNALSAQLRAELRQRLADAERDPAVRVVVLTHTGPAFCSGMDLTESFGATNSQQGVRELPALMQAIQSSAKPVVAKVAGPARAGGIGLMAACDIVVAARETTFAFTEVRLGLVPAVISSVVLNRLTLTAARELFLTGASFSADRALTIGLLNSVVPLNDLTAEVRRYTDMLILGGPHALAATKNLTKVASQRTDNELLELSVRHFASTEGQEGIAAFRAKQSPPWVAE